MKLITRIKLLILFTFIYSSSFGQTAIKRVLVEEYTGTWCASCAYGSVYFEHVADNYPNAIPVAIHNGSFQGEPMAILNVELYFLDYYSGSPTFLFDRTDFPNNPSSKPSVSASNTWEFGLDTLDSYMDMVYTQIPLATVGIDQSYNESTREVTVTITANFIQNTTGNFRLNCLILEDSVTGGTEYDQANSNFSGWTGAPAYLQDLVNKPTIITGYNHNHVLRSYLGDPEGVDSSIPTTVTAGSSYSKTFTYILPDGFDENQISLVGVVQKYGSSKVADRQIVNANSQHLNLGPVSVAESNQNIVDISVYPNPVLANSNMEFYVKTSDNVSCQIIDVNGKVVKVMFDEYFTQGEYRISLGDINLTEGIYFLKFTNSESTLIKKIVVGK